VTVSFADSIISASKTVSMSSHEDILSTCEARIGYQFRDRSLLQRCLTHSSAAETRLDSNERLEFFGDAVLGVVICEYLFQNFLDQREGQLTQMKSWLVSRQTCARVARSAELQDLILVGRGLQSTPDSILSAMVESLIAGVYFDGGLDAARQFILHSFREELALCRPEDAENYKSQLQELTQREFGRTPEYVIVEESGPDHAREFSIAVRIGESQFESGTGKTKKEAEQQAACNAVASLQASLEKRGSAAPKMKPAAATTATEVQPADVEPATPPRATESTNESFGAGCDVS